MVDLSPSFLALLINVKTFIPRLSFAVFLILWCIMSNHFELSCIKRLKIFKYSHISIISLALDFCVYRFLSWKLRTINNIQYSITHYALFTFQGLALDTIKAWLTFETRFSENILLNLTLQNHILSHITLTLFQI